MFPQAPEFERFLWPCSLGKRHAGLDIGPGLPHGSSPWAEGPRDGVICGEGAMNANWITASVAGVHQSGRTARKGGPPQFFCCANRSGSLPGNRDDLVAIGVTKIGEISAIWALARRILDRRAAIRDA